MRRSSACSAAVVTAKAGNLPATSEGGTLTVYFDGSCPLCAREIAFYRRRCAGDAARWVDVSRESPAALGAGLTRDQALERFHVRRADGTLCSGADAFTELWAEMPGMGAWTSGTESHHGAGAAALLLGFSAAPAIPRARVPC